MFKYVSEEEVLDLVSQVGRKISHSYPGVDASDIASEALTKLVARSDKLYEKSKGYLYGVLEREARAYAAKVRYDYVVSTSQYVYTPAEVRVLLEEFLFDPGKREVPVHEDDRLSAVVSGDTICVSIWDLETSFKNIKPEYQATIVDKYGLGWKVHPQKVSRAVDAITRSLNRIAAGTGKADNRPGARKAMSNSRARYVTATEGGHETDRYEEDALSKLQKERKRGKNDPPGTWYDWDWSK